MLGQKSEWTKVRSKQKVYYLILLKTNLDYLRLLELTQDYLRLLETTLDHLGLLETTGFYHSDFCPFGLLSWYQVDRCLKFSLKSIKHERNQKLFPLNRNLGSMNTRHSERFEVNFATTEAYRNSAIPFCQRLLNNHFQTKYKQYKLWIMIFRLRFIIAYV